MECEMYNVYSNNMSNHRQETLIKIEPELEQEQEIGQETELLRPKVVIAMVRISIVWRLERQVYIRSVCAPITTLQLQFTLFLMKKNRQLVNI